MLFKLKELPEEFDYGSFRWLHARSKVLFRDRFKCRKCLQDATEVDHIKSWRARPDLAYTLSNLQSLCGRCHIRKTQPWLKPWLRAELQELQPEQRLAHHSPWEREELRRTRWFEAIMARIDDVLALSRRPH